MVEITDKFSGVKEKSLSVEAVYTYPLFPIIFIFLSFFFFFFFNNSFHCFYKGGAGVS